MGFSRRNTEPELMDDPNIRETELREVLKDVNRANYLLGGNKITIEALAALMKKYPKEKYVIVDMGCGDGNILREVADFCRAKQLQVALIGIDLSEQALHIGRGLSKNYPEIHYKRLDVLKPAIDTLHCDIILCTLTMHHFDNTYIPIFLERLVNLAQIGIIINDLQRSKLAYCLFKGFSAIFIRTRIARHDGPISIKSGFTKKELIRFSKKLPRVNHLIKWKWAFRYVWVMITHQLSQADE